MFLTKLAFDAVRKRHSAGSVFSTLIECSVRFLQFVLGVAVIGLYAQDLVRAKNNGDPLDSKWLFATIVGSISALSALILLALPCITRRPLSTIPAIHLPTVGHDAVVSILWIVVFGIFRHKFYRGDSADDTGDFAERMRNAVWVDLASLLFWMFTLAWCGVRWWRGKRKAKKEGEKEQEAYDMNNV